MPSEFVIPTARPVVAATWAMSRVVVLLPFVPVTATTGMRGEGTDGREPSAVAFSPPSSLRKVLRPSAIRAAAAPMLWEIVRRRHGYATSERRPSAEERCASRGAGRPSSSWKRRA